MPIREGSGFDLEKPTRPQIRHRPGDTSARLSPLRMYMYPTSCGIKVRDQRHGVFTGLAGVDFRLSQGCQCLGFPLLPPIEVA